MSLSSPPGRSHRSHRHHGGGKGHRRTGSGDSQSIFSVTTHTTQGSHRTKETHGTFRSRGDDTASNIPHYMHSTVASIHAASPRAQSVRGCSSFESVRGGGRGSADEHRVDDRPVQEFADTLSSLPPDEWRSKTQALETLAATVPVSPEDERLRPSHQPGTVPWYRSPATLRRLAQPLREMLEDPRSTVVRNACENLAAMLKRVAIMTSPSLAMTSSSSSVDRPKESQQPQSDAGRYLMKDLLPTALGLHAQTVNVIRGYALQMMLSIIPCCRFKSGLPVLLERLRRDKSRDVREACARYLRAVLGNWSSAPSSSAVGGAYLTRDIAVHIGNALARAMMDPSQCVRMEARRGFEDFRRTYPEVWDYVVNREDGPLSKDLKLKKSIINAAVRADAERSLAGERLSSTAEKDENDEDGVSVSSFQSAHSLTSVHSKSSVERNRASGIPTREKGGIGKRTRSGHASSAGVSKRAGVGSMRSPAGKASQRATDREAFPPKSVLRAGRDNSSGKSSTAAAAQPFADVMKSPDPSKRRDSSLPIARNPGGDQGGGTSLISLAGSKSGEDVAYRAATSIQAAARGMMTRQKIMECVAEGGDVSSAILGDTSNCGEGVSAKDSGGGGEVSLELEMLRDARRAVNLGITAKQMAHRRQSSGEAAKDAFASSPANTEARDIADSCTTPKDSTPGNFGWKKGMPGQHSGATRDATQTFDFDQILPPPVGGSAARPPVPPRSSPMYVQTPESGTTGTSMGSDTVGNSPVGMMELRAATAEKLLTLRKASKSRDRKSSVMLQERLKRSSPGGEESRLPMGAAVPGAASPGLGAIQEHVAVAEEILNAHRKSMDDMMANLSLEMDVLRDFESMLNHRTNGGVEGNVAGRPSDDDVLEYFESVALCLDERTAIGERLRTEMDRIGRGESNGGRESLGEI